VERGGGVNRSLNTIQDLAAFLQYRLLSFKVQIAMSCFIYFIYKYSYTKKYLKNIKICGSQTNVLGRYKLIHVKKKQFEACETIEFKKKIIGPQKFLSP
jgi:hypothetical protein